MTVFDILQIILGILGNQNLIAKGVLITLLFLYGLFAVILLVQVKTLTTIVNQIHFSAVLQLLSLLHFLGALLLLLAVFLLL